jgi:hypothetical protein
MTKRSDFGHASGFELLKSLGTFLFMIFAALAVAIQHVVYFAKASLEARKTHDLDYVPSAGYDTEAVYEQNAQLAKAAGFPDLRSFMEGYYARYVEQCLGFQIAPVVPIRQALATIAGQLYEAEGLDRPFKAKPAAVDAIEEARYRDRLLARSRKQSNPQTLPLIHRALLESQTAFTRLLPKIAHAVIHPADADDGDELEPSATVPLIDVLPKIGHVVNEYILPFFHPDIIAAELFSDLRKQLETNLRDASSNPEDYKGTPSELVRVFLKHTPLDAVFKVSVPFEIPDHPYRFEHTFILGASGSGKTTLLQQIFLSDIAKNDPPAIVVIDPKGLLVDRIQHLDVFNPNTGRLKDRLIIIDPTRDNPALNMFAPTNIQTSDLIKRQIANQTTSNFAYIFSTLNSSLTQKQQVGFSFCARLLLSMPGATIHTLLDLMDDRARSLAESKFAPDVANLDPTAQRFFETDFYHPTEFRETKQQIKARLYGILARPELDACFSTVERRIDILSCLQSRKIVLVNCAMGLLGSESAQLFGRYMISLTLNGAFSRIAVPKKEWNSAFLLIDEAQLFVDEFKTHEMLSQAREYNLGITLAQQQIEGPQTLRGTISTNTTIKYAASVEAADLSYAARDLRCDPAFIQSQKRTATHANFACFVRNYIDRPVSISIPLGNIQREPLMTEEQYRQLLERNRERVSAPLNVAPTPTHANLRPETPRTETPPPRSGQIETRTAPPRPPEAPTMPPRSAAAKNDPAEPSDSW